MSSTLQAALGTPDRKLLRRRRRLCAKLGADATVNQNPGASERIIDSTIPPLTDFPDIFKLGTLASRRYCSGFRIVWLLFVQSEWRKVYFDLLGYGGVATEWKVQKPAGPVFRSHVREVVDGNAQYVFRPDGSAVHGR